MGKYAALCSLPSPTWVGWGSSYLFSSEPRSGLFPQGIIYYSNIHKTKVILHPPPGPATKSTFLSKRIIKLYILGMTQVSGITSFIKYLFLKELFFWTGLAVQLAVSALLSPLLLTKENTFYWLYVFKFFVSFFIQRAVLVLFLTKTYYMLFTVHFQSYAMYLSYPCLGPNHIKKMAQIS